MNWRELAKYFVHGVAFSLLFTFFIIGLTLFSVVLMMFGSFIGLIIVIGLMILMIGSINIEITERLWFSVKSEFWDILFHGLLLFIALLIVDGVLFLAPLLVFPGIGTITLTFIIGSFIDGFVCKKIAGLWEDSSGFFS